MLKIKKNSVGFLRNNIVSKVMVSALGAVMVLLALSCVLSNVFASASDYTFTADGVVELDGESDGSVTVDFSVVNGSVFTGFQGDFSVNETNDSNKYLTLTALTPGGSVTPMNNNISDGKVVYSDMYFVGFEVGAGNAIWSATYKVDKDTPAGSYTVSLSNAVVIGVINNYNGESLSDMTATVTVTRSGGGTGTKPSQEVTFRDGQGNIIGSEGITKSYGDDDFIVTKEVTVGDGVIGGGNYHPDDDASGPHVARTNPDSDEVSVDNVGNVDICVWLEETENYAATKACYTVHVVKRQLTITGANFRNKVYDGTTDVIVDSVSFSDRNLNNEEYIATAAFNNASAGNNKDIRVTVALTGGAENNYTLKSSYYDTKWSISPHQIVNEDVNLTDGYSYTYGATQIMPAVTVTANTHNGITTLIAGTDYDVTYGENVNVGNGYVYVTGKGNYTTGESSIVKEFTIGKQGIINDDLVLPNSIMKGHILASDEVSVRVLGRYLTMCANDGDSNCDYVLNITGNTGIVGDVVHVVAEGRNNYSGTAVGDINIVEKASQTIVFEDVTDNAVTATWGDANFTHVATVTVGNGSVKYSSSDQNVATVDEETGEVTIVGVGGAVITATASETATYAEKSTEYILTVNKKTISIESAGVADKTYNGTTVANVNSVVLSDSILVFNADYTATASFAAANVGSWSVDVYVTLSDNAYKNYQFYNESTHSASKDATYHIDSATISPLTLNNSNTTAVLNNTDYTYSGNQNKPTATVKVDLDGDGTKETTLSDGTDYIISYSGDTVNVGTKYATIGGTGNYSGNLSGLAYSVGAAMVDNVVVTAPAQTFNGSALEPVPVVTGVVNGNSVTFTTNDYYIINHNDFVNAGDYTFGVASGYSSNYYIPITNGTFTISPYEITTSNITLDSTMVRYNGNTQKVGVKVSIGDYEVDSSEYNVGYSADTIGNDETDTEVIVTVTAKTDKNITGSATATYTITPREVLVISGIDNQDVPYTGLPVELAGTLTVSSNSDGITPSSLITKWYASDGETEIGRPSNVGSYVVKYSYSNANYRGLLTANFNIVKAISPNPAEMTADLQVVSGETLANISGTRTNGFRWSDGSATVTVGQGTYAATYTYNDDADNYTTLNLAVPVYGLSLINVNTSVDGDGGEISESLVDVVEGSDITITLTPEDGYTLGAITVNGENMIGKVSSNTLTLTAGTSDLAVVAKFVPVYEVTRGARQVYTIGKSDVAEFEIDADYSLFENGGEVYVDGRLVTNYTSRSGSTIITFSAEYLNTLSVGTHTLAVIFNNGGIAATTFTIADDRIGVPDTGIFSGESGVVISVVALPIIILAVGIGTLLVYKRKDHKN